MVRIMGFSGHLDPNERITVDELCRFLGQFEDKTGIIFVLNREEVQLHGLRYHPADGQVRLLLKTVR